ncbi:hypothetical protein [Dyadobacter sp. 32]|uniref:hypothetical protein n=1 Tax=Dyadobacter sp. 32 TaxID=538966 RepID=UPI0011EDCC80
MKKTIILCLIALQGCNHVVPLKGNYQDIAASAVISKPPSAVWETVLDIIAERGYPVKFIDKESGILISDNISLNDHSSFETRTGTLYKPDAYIAAERFSNEYPTEARKYKMGATWTVRLKKLTDSTTLAKARLDQVTIDAYELNGKSTGKFEKWLLDELAR